MAVTTAQVIAEIQEELGNHPDLSDSVVKRLIQASNRVILAAERWEQEPQEVLLTVPAEVSGTDAGLTLDSATVTSAAAAAAWASRFFRKDDDKEYFAISSVSAGVSITLELAWPFASASSQAFTIFPRLITPHADAQEIHAVWGDERLEKRTLTWLNERDAPRTSTGDVPLVWVPAQRSSADVPRIEIWPRPTAATVLRVVYERSGTLSGDGTVPIYPAHLLSLRGAGACCNRLFARTNEKAWATLAKDKFEEYKIELQEAIIQNRDRVQAKSKVRKQGFEVLQTDFALNHDTYWRY